MDNREIAVIFSRIADALEIKGENPFRIRAYRVAAQNITSLSHQLEDLYRQNPEMSEKIPGIGKDLKEKIIEMIRTGRLKYYDELMKEFSAGFLEMLDLEGLGPKKLKKLQDELGIKNVDDLERACKSGKVAVLEGMGEKTEEKLIEAIKHFRGHEGRMLLPEAVYHAEKIISYLKKDKNFKRVEKAGSLRRGKELIRDLDILATAADAKRAMDHFVGYPDVENVIAKGPTKASVSLREGPQVDLRVIDEGSFGAALVYFTGSKQHNIAVRKIAKTKGFKVSEYGVFLVNKSSKKEKFVAGKTEKEVYEKLGMRFIPPELREAQGEVEAAMKNKLPASLVEVADIRGDLHMHTVETDGHATLEDMVEAARRKGYEYMAITEHSKQVRVANGMDEKRLLKHAAKIRKLAGKTRGIKVLVGVEVDILQDGRLDLEDWALKELDVVIAAVHSFFNLDKYKQTARVLRAMDNKYVNVLAHPSGRLITSRNAIQADFDRIFKKAAGSNIYLEINTHGNRIDLNDAHAKRAKELGARLVVNTDAHDTSQLDGMFYGIITARRGWLEKKDVLNTQTCDKMIKALKR